MERIAGNSTRSNAIRVVSVGHAVFAVMMVSIGVIGLVRGVFTPTWVGVPKAVPLRVELAYLCGLVSLLTGIGLLWRRTALIAASVLLSSLLIWMLLFRIYPIVIAPKTTDPWWACGDTAVMIGAAWVLYVWFAADRGRPGLLAGDTGLHIARVFYGLGLIPFGIAHFTNLDRTVSMVPGWLPWHLGWAYFTGISLIVAGVAIVIGVYGRLAAALSALELGLFTLLVWGPVVVAGPRASDWGEIISSCVLTAAAWVVADSYRGMPWLAIGRR